MARAAVRTLRPRQRQSDGRVYDHPVTAKISSSDFDLLTALGVIDETSPADQIRGALDFYFTLRMKDRASVEEKIARARARHEAVLSALTGQQAEFKDEVEAPDVLDTQSEPYEKSVTLRVDTRGFDLMTAFSIVDDVSLADVLRAAIAGYISFRKEDPELGRKLVAAKTKYDNTMAVLASGSGTYR